MQKRILALSICFIMLLGMTGFVSASDHSADLSNQVQILSVLNIISGYPDGTVKPEKLLSRAEFAKIGVAASSFRNAVPGISVTSPFIDVPYSHWAAPYITASIKNKLVTGYPDATFRPDQTVTLEEVVTILLRILGYQDADFGTSWPYGQMAMAAELKLTEGIRSTVGQPVTRGDAIVMLYHLMNTKPKAAQTDYISSFQYAIVKDVTLIATSDEDASVGAGKILTSAGTYEPGDQITKSNLYQTGDLLVDTASNQITLFMPDTQNITQYVVYSVVGKDILYMQGEQKKVLYLEDDVPVYHKSQKTTLGSLRNVMETGSILRVYTGENGAIQYAVYEKQGLSGPVTVQNASWTSRINLPDIQSAAVYRDSIPASLPDIMLYDVVYYSASLNTVWAYCKKVTGVYEKALPNQDMPTAIVVSGQTYAISEPQAFQKIAAGGGFSYGDTVTLLYGNQDQIVDVIAADALGENMTGYVTETGRKNFEKPNGNTYAAYYVKTVLADGTAFEVPANKDYKDYLCSLVDIKLDGQTAALRKIGPQPTLGTAGDVSGMVDANRLTIGEDKISPTVQILDIGNLQNNNSPQYQTVFLKRLHHVRLSSGQILRAVKNSRDEIQTLYLNNVTGDYNQYGIVVKSKVISHVTDMSITLIGTYEYDINGSYQDFTSNNMAFSVEGGSPAAFTFTPSSTLERIVPLQKFQEPVQAVRQTAVTVADAEYLLADGVTVYQKSGSNYMKIPLSELIGKELSSTYAYYDKLPERGGRVRVLVVRDF